MNDSHNCFVNDRNFYKTPFTQQTYAFVFRKNDK